MLWVGSFRDIWCLQVELWWELGDLLIIELLDCLELGFVGAENRSFRSPNLLDSL